MGRGRNYLPCFPPQRNGRPRERFYVADLEQGAIDANALRREARERGRDIAEVPTLHLAWTDRDGEELSTAIPVEIEPHPVYRWRWWLRCPRCDRRLGKLYLDRGRQAEDWPERFQVAAQQLGLRLDRPAGLACRGCLRLRYGQGR